MNGSLERRPPWRSPRSTITAGRFKRHRRSTSSSRTIPAIPRPWSVFYLLHGLSDDHTIWMRRTSIERYVEGLPLVVVMPDGGRGWYTNAAVGLGLRRRPDQGCRRPGRPHVSGQGRTSGTGDRRPLDGRLWRGQARFETPRDVRQRQLALGGRRCSARPQADQGPEPRIRADLRQLAQGRTGRPRRHRRKDRPRTDPRAAGSIAAPTTSCSKRIGRSIAISSHCTSRTNTRSFPAATTGPTGTSTFRKPWRSTHGICN